MGFCASDSFVMGVLGLSWLLIWGIANYIFQWDDSLNLGF